MKNIRVITMGILCSWVALQLIYIPFVEYFLNKSSLFAYSLALETSDNMLHPLTTDILITSLVILSISIGMFVATFIYRPIEVLLLNKTKIKNLFF